MTRTNGPCPPGTVSTAPCRVCREKQIVVFFENPHRVMRLSSRLLAGGLVILVVGILLAYGGETVLSIHTLLGAHLMTIWAQRPSRSAMSCACMPSTVSRLLRQAGVRFRGGQYAGKRGKRKD